MGQPPYIQKVVPCECGSTDAYWHGPEDGARDYCCDRCWRKILAGRRRRVVTTSVACQKCKGFCICHWGRRIVTTSAVLLLVAALGACSSALSPASISSPPVLRGSFTVLSSDGNTAPYAIGESAAAAVDQAAIALGNFRDKDITVTRTGEDWRFVGPTMAVSVPATGPATFELRAWGATMRGEIR